MKKILILLMVFIVIFLEFVFGENIQARFKGQEKLTYGVYFNGVSVGKIVWEYLGCKIINGKNAYVLAINSDANILKLLNLESKEEIFIDSSTNLPLKVERDVVFFGKKELIEEIYDQEAGSVRIIRRNSHKKEEIIFQDKPVHNILALLYFFPKNIELELGKTFVFNLPTQKVKIKMVSVKPLRLKEGVRESYFLLGRGAKKFNLWLDKEERLPLRMEFITVAGKIIIKREFESKVE